jgi:hypothetical protein
MLFYEQWEKINTGMNVEEVIIILGPPDHQSSEKYVWYINFTNETDMFVVHIKNNIVIKVSNPMELK